MRTTDYTDITDTRRNYTNNNFGLTPHERDGGKPVSEETGFLQYNRPPVGGSAADGGAPSAKTTCGLSACPPSRSDYGGSTGSRYNRRFSRSFKNRKSTISSGVEPNSGLEPNRGRFGLQTLLALTTLLLALFAGGCASTPSPVTVEVTPEPTPETVIEDDRTAELWETEFPRAVEAFEKGKYKTFLEILETLPSRPPQTTAEGDIPRMKGIAFYHVGNYAESIALLDRFVQNNERGLLNAPAIREEVLLLAQGHMALEHYPQAIGFLKAMASETIPVPRSNLEIINLLGESYLKNGEHEKIFTLYRPGYLETLEGADLLIPFEGAIKMGNFDTAFEFFFKALNEALYADKPYIFHSDVAAIFRRIEVPHKEIFAYFIARLVDPQGEADFDTDFYRFDTFFDAIDKPAEGLYTIFMSMYLDTGNTYEAARYYFQTLSATHLLKPQPQAFVPKNKKDEAFIESLEDIINAGKLPYPVETYSKPLVEIKPEIIPQNGPVSPIQQIIPIENPADGTESFAAVSEDMVLLFTAKGEVIRTIPFGGKILAADINKELGLIVAALDDRSLIAFDFLGRLLWKSGKTLGDIDRIEIIPEEGRILTSGVTDLLISWNLNGTLDRVFPLKAAGSNNFIYIANDRTLLILENNGLIARKFNNTRETRMLLSLENSKEDYRLALFDGKVGLIHTSGEIGLYAPDGKYMGIIRTYLDEIRSVQEVDDNKLYIFGTLEGEVKGIKIDAEGVVHESVSGQKGYNYTYLPGNGQFAVYQDNNLSIQPADSLENITYIDFPAGSFIFPRVSDNTVWGISKEDVFAYSTEYLLKHTLKTLENDGIEFPIYLTEFFKTQFMDIHFAGTSISVFIPQDDESMDIYRHQDLGFFPINHAAWQDPNTIIFSKGHEIHRVDLTIQDPAGNYFDSEVIFTHEFNIKYIRYAGDSLFFIDTKNSLYKIENTGNISLLENQMETKSRIFGGPDKGYISVLFFDEQKNSHILKSWNTDGSPLSAIELGENEIPLGFISDYKLALSVGGRYIKIVDIEKTDVSPIYLINTGDDVLVCNQDLYFDSAELASKSVLLNYNNELVSPAHFRLILERGDILYNDLGSVKDYMIEEKRQNWITNLDAYELEKSDGIENLHVPEIRIISNTQNYSFADITFQLNDSKYFIINYNVTVNGVSLFRQYGRRLRLGQFTSQQRIELKDGKTVVEISCINEKGVETVKTLEYIID